MFFRSSKTKPSTRRKVIRLTPDGMAQYRTLLQKIETSRSAIEVKSYHRQVNAIILEAQERMKKRRTLRSDLIGSATFVAVARQQ